GPDRRLPPARAGADDVLGLPVRAGRGVEVPERDVDRPGAGREGRARRAGLRTSRVPATAAVPVRGDRRVRPRGRRARDRAGRRARVPAQPGRLHRRHPQRRGRQRLMAIKTRKPTGAVPWPLILLEGGEKAGKSWACAELSASEKVGQTYWLDLSEGAADEYGAVPGARYLVVEHNGTWQDIVGQVAEIREEAARAADAGEPPVVL